MAPHCFAEGCSGIPGGEKRSFIPVASGLSLPSFYKKWCTFPTKINSSSPIKHNHIHSLSHHPRVHSIKFGIGQVDVRTSMHDHLHLLRWPKWESIVPLSSKYGRGTLMPWHCITLQMVPWVYQVEKNPTATIIHSSYMQIKSAQLLKNSTAFPTKISLSLPIKHKQICSLMHHHHVLYQMQSWPSGYSNE